MNGIADMTKRIQDTLARHGVDEKPRSNTSQYDNTSRSSYNGRLSDNRYTGSDNRFSGRESRDREIQLTVNPSPNTGSWRRRHDSTQNNEPYGTSPSPVVTSPTLNNQSPKWEIDTSQNLCAMKTVISRSTSPTPIDRQNIRTRIARTTDPIVVEHRRSRKPRVMDASCQTDVIPEFGTLADYLNPPPPPPPVPVVLKDKSPEVSYSLAH